MQNHRNILHHGMRVANALHISADDRIALFASLSTGQAKTVMYYALLNGATLYPRHIKEEGLTHLAAWLSEEEITIYHSSATVFRAFIDTLTGGETFAKLRLVRVGSETVAPTRRGALQNLFSPTLSLPQFTVLHGDWHDPHIPDEQRTSIDESMVPVGYAVEGVEVLLLDENGVEVGLNQPGEIIVKSRYLSPGDWRGDLPRPLFWPTPRAVKHASTAPVIWAPAARWLSGAPGPPGLSGQIRGHRIEVAEVEQVLRGHADIKDVVVMAQPHAAGEQHLVAYLVPTQQPGPSIRTLQAFVQRTLPDYMVPTAFVLLAALPLTPGGKVDRQRLPAPVRVRPQLGHPYVVPRTPIERSW